MKIQGKILAGLAVFGLVAAGPVLAQSTTTAHRMTADSNFITKAAQGGMAEVELGQLATTHASNQSVKDFGQKMVDDHSKANEELKSIAAKEGVTLPTTVSAKDQATRDRLSKLNGAEFDRAYMADMVKDHRMDVAEFRREADHGTDPDVKAFAAKTLPTLENHLKLAETTDSQLKK
ncbi:MAG: DUF4142 domain-containing protein [Acidobacteriia bacterium]|nr:DUF4142 domain-containing protein [Terriglobia bacterium]